MAIIDLKALVSGKALPAHPALMGDIGSAGGPLTLTPRQGRVGTPLSQTEASRHLEAYGGKHDAIDWVMDCVSLVADSAAGAEWFLEREGERLVNERGPFTPEDAEEAPKLLVDLIEQPNPHQDYTELIELLIIDFLLVGNAYWLKFRTNAQGQPLNIFRLAPPYVHIEPGPFGPAGYRYRVSGEQNELRFKPEDVVHFRRANPHNPYYGMGIIQQAARALDLELGLTDTQASYYEKAAMPSLVVQSDRRVPEPVHRKLRNQLRSMFSGPRNAGSLMVLEAGLKATSVAPTAVDAAFEALTKLSRDRIAGMFRVPVPLAFPGSGTGDATINSAQRVFDNKTMKPLLGKLQRPISTKLTGAWGCKFKFDYNYVIPEEEKLKLTGQYASIPGIKVREVREYAGREPLGDWRDEIVLNLPGIDGEPGDTRMGHPDRNLPGEAGRPPAPDNTEVFPENPEDVPSTAAVSLPGRRRSERGKALTSELVEAAKASHARQRRGTLGVEEIAQELDKLAGGKAARDNIVAESAIIPPEDDQYRDRTATIDAIASEARRDLIDAATALERQLLDHVEGKAARSPITRIKRSSAWAAFNRKIRDILDRAVHSALSAANIHLSQRGIRAPEVDYDAMAKALLNRSEGGVTSIRDTLRDELVQKLSKALEGAEDRRDFERAVRESIDFWRENKAETVALTEAVTAFNFGTVSIAQQAGVGSFLVSDGEDHDEPCREANGQTWDADRALANPLEHPRCRRAFVPVTA